MATPTTAGSAATNGNKKLNNDGTPRKKAERIPRTPEEVAFGACNNVLKRIPAEMRSRVMKSLTALYGAS